MAGRLCSNTRSESEKSSGLYASGVFFAGVVGDTLGGVISDYLLRRTGRVTFSRLVVTGPTLTSGLGSVDEFQDTVSRYAAIGVTDLVVHWPRANAPYKADHSIFEQIFAR